MKRLIQHFPQQLKEALEIGRGATLKPAPRQIRNVLICGMGGSGIGANLIQSLLSDELSVPVSVSKAYSIPHFVGEDTLVIGGSYSGGTEETITAVKQAISRGAYVVGITSGGKLGQLLKENGFEYITIPSRDNSPRAGLGYSFVQLLKVFSHFGLSNSDHFSDIEEAMALLEENQPTIEGQGKHLAQRLKDKFPILYADSRLEPVVIRTQQQIAENSKQLSHQNVFPEMNHNELVGWMYPKWLFDQSVTIMLYTDYDHERTRMRMDICRDIFRKQGTELIEFTAQGKSLIAQSLYLIHMLDWMSLYLADENSVDPFPVDVIGFLKDELGKR